MAPLTGGGRPVTTWAAAAERLPGSLHDLTVRNVVRTTVGGTGLRVRLTNAFGDREVTFGHVYLGVGRAGAALVPGSNRRLTFGGRAEVRLAPGATVLSDPLPGPVPARQRLAVSLYLRGDSGVLTGRNRATAPAYGQQAAFSPVYRSMPGDHAADEDGGAYTEEAAVWHWLDALIVVAPEPVSAVAVLGDSLTTGVGSETGHGWTDLLAWGTELTPGPGLWADNGLTAAGWLAIGSGIAVVNEGVSGGKVLAAGTGRAAEDRLTAEVLTKPGIDLVILAAGVNDLGAGARAEDLIAAYRRIVTAAHAAGVRVIGATITPFTGAVFHSPDAERARQEVNAFIREADGFDGLIDFDAALRDPADPARLLPRHDSGDHLHPSIAGHQAMAGAVDLDSLRPNHPPAP
ncbi:GDSL-type esterase/lipase family protein [Nonomuraea sp. NPDC048892]|uniref:GDSL-type esterase/lipase family protein n=1 Tax=Nonomuraea sp. NPDC048892 TaxID=3154624 RepID=UPI0033F335C2